VHVNIERILILLRAVIQLYKTIYYRIRASWLIVQFLRIAICEFQFSFNYCRQLYRIKADRIAAAASLNN